MAEQSIAEKLRNAPIAVGEAMFGAHKLLTEAADELDRLTKERDAARLGRDILRQQLRDAGIEPLVTE